MKDYNADTMINDVANSKMAQKAKSWTDKISLGGIWRFIRDALIGIMKAVLFAPLHVTLFPIMSAFKNRSAK